MVAVKGLEKRKAMLLGRCERGILEDGRGLICLWELDALEVFL